MQTCSQHDLLTVLLFTVQTYSQHDLLILVTVQTYTQHDLLTVLLFTVQTYSQHDLLTGLCPPRKLTRTSAQRLVLCRFEAWQCIAVGAMQFSSACNCLLMVVIMWHLFAVYSGEGYADLMSSDWVALVGSL